MYDLLVEFLEWFNENWSVYHLYIEPFLEGSEEIIGMFSDTGLYVFFYLDVSLPGRYRKEDSTNVNVLRYTINPNNFIKQIELEVLFLEGLTKLNSLRGKMNYARK